jgi:hypothetical protein
MYLRGAHSSGDSDQYNQPRPKIGLIEVLPPIAKQTWAPCHTTTAS